MTFDDPGWPLIDDFIVDQAQHKSAATVRRYVRARDRLTHFLDVGDMTRWLGSDLASLLESEREFHVVGAFWTLFGADELVCCLPGALEDPWLPEGVGEARTHISVMGRLVTHLVQRGLARGMACARLDTEGAIAQARRQLADRSRRQQPDSWATEMPERFRPPPAAEW